MRRFRDRENYDNYERDNFDRDSSSRGNSFRNADNNFDRMYNSREYSRDENSRRFDERTGGYSRPDYSEGYGYSSQDRRGMERDYDDNRYSRYEERPRQDNGYYNRPDSRPNGPIDSENKVVFFTPKSYEDIQNLIDSLKKKQSLIVDVSDLDAKNTQRYLDFLSGAIYALNGSYQKIDNKKFYFAPQGVSITIPFDLRQKKE